MKKVLWVILIIAILFPNFIAKAEAKNTWYFVVTAYYSPLPNQNYYLTGNYKAEKRLNWEGIRWASGKRVFSWMLAAPKIYRFWTKIFLEWLGVWEVSDRWWAIVSAWNRWYSHDRIDVWVWYWDEWLRRALYWGKRKIKWEIISKNAKVTIDYHSVASPKWATKWLKTIPTIFEIGLWKGSNPKYVKKLKTLLKETWHYKWKVDWVYDYELINTVYKFQIDNRLIKWPNSYWAWYWWWTTRKLFLKKYLNWEFDKVQKVETKVSIEKKELNIFDGPVNSIKEVKKLQEVLKTLGYYNWKITWVKKDTIDPIYDFQVKKWIVKYVYSAWAWSFWPKTRKTLKQEYDTYIEKQEAERLEKLRIEEEKRKEAERKKALEQKYKRLEELSISKATKKINYISNSEFWEISHRVRDLQILLKDLWYFEYKDTAIYWDKTKQSIIKYQIEKNIIKSEDELWAGIIWPKTKASLKNDLQNKILKQLISSENIDLEQIVALLWKKI